MNPAGCCAGCVRSGRRRTMRVDGAWWRCCRSGYGLRARPTAVAWGSSREALDGQRTHTGSPIAAVAGPGNGSFPDAPRALAGAAVSLCGGSVAGTFVWMVDAVDYATTWVELRAMWGRGQVGTLSALRDMEASLPFALLGLDSDNGGEFLNHHVLAWLQKRPRPVFMTRSRPYKKDDNAHVEQKNWTHIRQCFGYERHDNPEVVEPMNALVKGAYGQLLNFFHASLKLERKERKEGRVRRIYAEAQTPLARVLASAQVTAQTKRTVGAGEGWPQSIRLETRGGPELERDCLIAPGASVERMENRAPGSRQKTDGWYTTAGGRELRLKGRPPARLTCNQSANNLQRSKTEKQKQQRHWVTHLLAQRITLSGNSYFWRTGACQNTAVVQFAARPPPTFAPFALRIFLISFGSRLPVSDFPRD